jgi:putative endonuclease
LRLKKREESIRGSRWEVLKGQIKVRALFHMEDTRKGPGGKRSHCYHYVYVLNCANGELYTGYTTDPDRRLRLHNLGIASKFTRSRLPVTMVHLEKFPTRSMALKREIQIKKMKKREKLRLCAIN